MVERGVIAQLQAVVTLDPVRLTDAREHLRLLDRVDPQIRLQIQIHVQQIRRITRLLRHDRQHPPLDIPSRSRHRRHRRHGRGCRWRGLRRPRAALGALVDEGDDVVERGVIAQLQAVVTLDPVRLTDAREHLRLLDRVDPQIRLQIQIHVQQIRRITRLLRHDRQHPPLDIPQPQPPPAPAPRDRSGTGAGDAGAGSGRRGLAASERSLTKATTWLSVG